MGSQVHISRVIRTCSKITKGAIRQERTPYRFISEMPLSITEQIKQIHLHRRNSKHLLIF